MDDQGLIKRRGFWLLALLWLPAGVVTTAAEPVTWLSMMLMSAGSLVPVAGGGTARPGDTDCGGRPCGQGRPPAGGRQAGGTYPRRAGTDRVHCPVKDAIGDVSLTIST